MVVVMCSEFLLGELTCAAGWQGIGLPFVLHRVRWPESSRAVLVRVHGLLLPDAGLAAIAAVRACARVCFLHSDSPDELASDVFPPHPALSK